MTISKLTRPQEFWRDHVLPNCEEYRKHRNSMRHAMNAAMSAFHMADWVWTTYHDTKPQKVGGTRTVTDYSVHLASHGCPDFLLLKDIAEAHKHLKLDRPTRYDRTVTSAGATGLGHIGAITRLGPTGPMAARKRLVVEQQDGGKRAFDEVIESVIQMWEELIEREGL